MSECVVVPISSRTSYSRGKRNSLIGHWKRNNLSVALTFQSGVNYIFFRAIIQASARGVDARQLLDRHPLRRRSRQGLTPRGCGRNAHRLRIINREQYSYSECPMSCQTWPWHWLSLLKKGSKLNCQACISWNMVVPPDWLMNSNLCVLNLHQILHDMLASKKYNG